MGIIKERVDEIFVNPLNPIRGLVGEIDFKNFNRSVCNEPFNKMVILSNGQVTTCCDDFNGEIELGNVNHNSIKNIWLSEKWNQLRRKFLKLDYSTNEICQKCIFSYEVPKEYLLRQ